jgi:hypothetical protein
MNELTVELNSDIPVIVGHGQDIPAGSVGNNP